MHLHVAEADTEASRARAHSAAESMLPERKIPIKKSFAFLLQKLEEELDLQRGVVGQIRAVDTILSLVRPKSGSECPRADMLGNVRVCVRSGREMIRISTPEGPVSSRKDC